MLARSLLLLTVAALLAFPLTRVHAAPLELRDGDRIAFLGNSFFEQALDHGYLETSLTLRHPDRQLIFRNLGWDGDTVFGHSRTGGRRRATFGDPAEGFSRMIAHLDALDPTVIFIAYGRNESFHGESGVDSFREGLERLLDEAGGNKRRFILLAPTPAERGFGTELPLSRKRAADYITARNKTLRTYRDVIATVAEAGGHHFVDLFSALEMSKSRYSANGIHPSPEGYRRIAKLLATSLELPEPAIDLGSKAAETLRRTIVKKNTLYYHRWRPRNDAFVYGERKSEQKPAQSEPEQFEPFVAAREEEIRKQLEGLR